MCDTMGFFHEGSAIFAKNSDRSPNEPQVLEYIPAKDHEETELKVTYTTIPQVPHTKAILISRPVWLWGAERDALEADFLIHKDSKAAAEADKAFYERWSAEKLKKVPTSYQFRNRWAKKTKVLKDETK